MELLRLILSNLPHLHRGIADRSRIDMLHDQMYTRCSVFDRSKPLPQLLFDIHTITDKGQIKFAARYMLQVLVAECDGSYPGCEEFDFSPLQLQSFLHRNFVRHK